MTKKDKVRGKLSPSSLAPGANPQGWGQDVEFAEESNGQLENAAKKVNKK